MTTLLTASETRKLVKENYEIKKVNLNKNLLENASNMIETAARIWLKSALITEIYSSPSATISRIKNICQESSLIGDYDGSLDNPGSSYLWIGSKVMPIFL